MSDALNLVYNSIDDAHADKPAATRRQLVAGAAATIGGMGLLGLAGEADAAPVESAGRQSPETILNIAATAEVLATIVNTVGWERNLGGDTTTQANLAAAAREELIHYRVLTSRAVGARPVTRTIYVPNEVFASRENLLNTLIVGDQIFVNAYLIGITAFGNRGSGRLARIASEIMGVEAVHRAVARQSLGLLGNDRAFMKYSTGERARGPLPGLSGFRNIGTAVTQLQSVGFGFGKQGSKPGTAYTLGEVAARTPNPPGVNTLTPR